MIIIILKIRETSKKYFIFIIPEKYNQQIL